MGSGVTAPPSSLMGQVPCYSRVICYMIATRGLAASCGHNTFFTSMPNRVSDAPDGFQELRIDCDSGAAIRWNAISRFPVQGSKTRVVLG
jgi:hypothetical protein